MSVLVADCPRCGAKQMTFDAKSQIHVATHYSWQQIWELFCCCRNCRRSTTFVVAQKSSDQFYDQDDALVSYRGSLNPLVELVRYLSLRDVDTQTPPEHVTEEIASAFTEASTCLAVECWNASATMFRLCIDLATRPLLPAGETAGLNGRTRRDLGLRLPWLFDNGKLPGDLRELSASVREDGNDGAHAGTLTKADAEDLLDFTTALLERMYTEPERLRLAAGRRLARRQPKG
jgi:hypothetical protein